MSDPYRLHGEDSPLMTAPLWAVLVAVLLINWRLIAAIVGLTIAAIALAAVLP